MKTIKELNQIKEENLLSIQLRQEEQKDIPIEAKDMGAHLTHVLICGGTGCHSSNGDKIRELLAKRVQEKGLDNIKIVLTGCFGLCEAGPNIVIFPEGGIFYSHVKLEDVDEIVESHFERGGQIVERLLFKESKKRRSNQTCQ